MFYQSVVASTIFFTVVSWGAGIKAKDANRLNKLIKKAGSVVGSERVTLKEVVGDRMLAKLLTTPLTPSIKLSSQRKSFLPGATRLYNVQKKTQNTHISVVLDIISYINL